MCGLAGALRPGCREEDWRRDLPRMAGAIAHRGPDAEGFWFDAEAGIGMAHRRLSILDLSPQGNQPMLSANGRFVIAYNGEVYNFEDLREELDGYGFAWRSHSDTEVILAAIQTWGPRGAIDRFIGMFAFALWDKEARELSLVRDRLGIKPLYYGWGQDAFLFGSELKALRASTCFRAVLNRDALALQLRHGYIPAPHSIYRQIFKLKPGGILTLSLDAVAAPERVTHDTYWSVAEVAETSQQAPFGGSPGEAADELDRLLRDAIKRRMVADVPLGAFLSGGIDSSTVVSLMQAQSGNPVKTFSIGFDEGEFDEARFARRIAEHLGTDHQELYVTPDMALAVVPKLPQLYDEPFSDPSQIPTYLVSAMARRDVTVCLSGDGGDELFAGYTRYAECDSIWRKVSWMPPRLRGAVAKAITPNAGVGPDFSRNLAELLRYRSQDELYLRLVSHWKDPARVVIGAEEPATAFGGGRSGPTVLNAVQDMMLQDFLVYLPDDILTKVDRASMGVGLEARVPLLDHRVVAFCWSLPHAVAAGAVGSKKILRSVLHRYLPPGLFERPKKGFGLPIASWLRGPLRDWAEELLREARLRQDGVFDPTPIRRMWQEHLSGARERHYYLWDILMFQAWQETVSADPQPNVPVMAAK